MTRIRMCYERDGYRVSTEGHAGTSASCAAVSAIVQALAGWVHNHVGAIQLEKGRALITFPKQEGADAVFELTTIGLLQVQRAAPEDVSVTVCEE